MTKTIEALLQTNVNDHIEKKNGLSYLSWAWAWAEALKVDPKATYSVQMFGERCFMDINGTAMVWVTVTIFDKPMTCQLPVMDHRNKAIQSPDAFAVNTAIMRCMTKALALHGLGLYIYAGEDLPEEPPKAKLTQEDIARIDFVLDACPTLDELKKEFLSAHKQAAEANDGEAIKHFTNTKDTVKARLEKAQ